MSLKSRFFSIIAAAFCVAVFSSFSIAQDTTPQAPAPERAEKRARGDREFGRDKMKRQEFGGRQGKKAKLMRGIRALNLTDEQKAKIKSIREANKPVQATMTELRTIREARKSGTAITPEQQARLKEFREQSIVKMKAAREQILAILTPEQKAQINTRRTEMRQRFEERKANRKSRPAAPATDKPVIN